MAGDASISRSRFADWLSRIFSPERWPAMGLVVITLLAVGCRLHALTESLWVDELHTSWTIQGSLVDVFSRAGQGNQGPLYFLLQWLWIAVVGESELTLRFPSLVAGIMLPAVVYWATRQIIQEADSARIGLLAAALAATDDYAIFYAQEARPYAWVMLISIWHFVQVVRWQRQPSRSLLWQIGLGCLVLFYLHFTTALLFLAEAVGLLAAWLWNRRKIQWDLREIALVVTIVVLAIVPTLPQLREIAARSPNWKMFVDKPMLADLIGLFPASVAIAGIWIWPVLERYQGKSLERQTQFPAMLWLLCWLAIPLCTAWIYARFDIARLFFPRYLLCAMPASWFLPPLAIRFVRDRREWLLGVSLVFLGWNYYQTPWRTIWNPPEHGVRNEDWRGAIAFLNEELSKKTGEVYVDAGFIEPTEDRDYWKLPVLGLYRLKIDEQKIRVNRKEIIFQSFYWVLSRDENEIRLSLEKYGTQQKLHSFGKVVVEESRPIWDH